MRTCSSLPPGPNRKWQIRLGFIAGWLTVSDWLLSDARLPRQGSLPFFSQSRPFADMANPGPLRPRWSICLKFGLTPSGRKILRLPRQPTSKAGSPSPSSILYPEILPSSETFNPRPKRLKVFDAADRPPWLPRVTSSKFKMAPAA